MSSFLDTLLQKWAQQPAPPKLRLEIHGGGGGGGCHTTGSRDTVFTLHNDYEIERRSTQSCVLMLLRLAYENDDIAMLITLWLRELQKQAQTPVLDPVGFDKTMEECIDVSTDWCCVKEMYYNEIENLEACVKQIKSFFIGHANDGNITCSVAINLSEIYQPVVIGGIAYRDANVREIVIRGIMAVLIVSLVLNISSIGLTVHSHHDRDLLFDMCFDQLHCMGRSTTMSRGPATLALWLNKSSSLYVVPCHHCMKEESPSPVPRTSPGCMQQ